MKNIKSLYPLLIVLIGALMLIITFFVPFASAKEEYREKLLKYPDSVYSQEADMKNSDAVDISLPEFIKIDTAAADMGISEQTAIANMVLIIAFGVFAVLTLLFSILRKPIAIIIFDILSLGSMLLIKFDFEDRGIIPSSMYDWGIAQIICFIGIVIVAVGAVIMLVTKIISKRNAAANQ